MIPYFYYFLAWFFIIFCQVVVSPRIAIGDIYPDIVMATVVLIGLKQGWKRGLWFGFAFGLTMDLIDPQNYGWITVLLSLSGYLAGYVREKIFLDHILYQSLAVLTFSLVYQLLFQLVNWPLYFVGNFLQLTTDALFISLYSALLAMLALFALGQRSRIKELL
jgi:rod shape-determining protein MreD